MHLVGDSGQALLGAGHQGDVPSQACEPDGKGFGHEGADPYDNDISVSADAHGVTEADEEASGERS